MDLLKYLEPMKNLPERFSNLAFWRGVRKLRDEVVNAFEYIDSWGESVESELAQIKSIDYTKCKRLTVFDEVKQVDFHVIEDATNDVVIIMFDPPGATVTNMPTDFGAIAGVEYIVEMETNNGIGSDNVIIMTAEIIKIRTGPDTFGYLLNTNSTCGVAIDKLTVHDWKKPYKATVIRGTLVYYPTI